jgi:hypothetical protein|tara:strand:- start:570 stop:728 length:159 start_codon:yes stop_codon:yes gene_type:complete
MGSLQPLPHDESILRAYCEYQSQTEGETFESSRPDAHAHVDLRSAAFFLSFV